LAAEDCLHVIEDDETAVRSQIVYYPSQPPLAKGGDGG